MDTTAQLRSHFLAYFARHDHKVVPSSSLVPQNDPTLMFTNAGMVQFKNVFTGLENRDYKKAASSQKCVRAGGKHNDLENVGHTARHHTFFEMLGNFSFGDYFKDQAIDLAWKLITQELGVDKKRLLVTVFADDDEAAKLWKSIAGLPDEKIIRIATTDNFWSMGETGPCGPCSEIFYDHGEHIPGGPPGSPDEDGDRFVELWNLVFMQYEIPEPGAKMIALPKPSIDTGSGLERLSAVMQGVHNNYDIDLFKNLINASQSAIGRQISNGEELVSHRVIADHMRSTCFLIADGVMPSNEGRGYVLRRIMRRGMRHAHILGCEEPLMHRLVPALITEMGSAFPELVRAESLLKEVLEIEETRFKQTLGRGLKLLNEETSRLASGKALPGEVAFKLYDTYGFPLDLTQDVLKAENRDVDTTGFQVCMDKQKADARASWSGSGDQKQEKIWFELIETHGSTEFLGYTANGAEGKILALVKNGKIVESVNAGDEVSILVNQTPFYGESGGQMGDTGVMCADQSSVSVNDTVLKVKGLIVHMGHVSNGMLKTGETVHLQIDEERRADLRANHSGTHLLHATLRHQIGGHIIQKGSLVAPDKFRFDFSHNSALSEAQIRSIEDEVNARIRMNTEVKTRLMAAEKAQETGAMALFGEKYDEEVRVVSMGGHFEHSLNTEKEYSLELCGGTHVNRTGDIGLLKILSDTGVAAGIRRIEAVTGRAAFAYIQEMSNQLAASSDLLKTSPAQLTDKIDSLIQEKKRLEKEIKNLTQKLATGSKGEDTKDINGVKFVHRELENIPANDLKPTADQIKQQMGSGVVMITSVADNRVSVVIGVTKDLTERINAVTLVKVASEALGGSGGGGRPDMAQAGGPNPNMVLKAVDTVIKAIGDSV